VISYAPIEKADIPTGLAGFSFSLLELLLPIMNLPAGRSTIVIFCSEPGMLISIFLIDEV
jgi:hypothetical protein